jgi:CHC2 zinc finger
MISNTYMSCFCQVHAATFSADLIAKETYLKTSSYLEKFFIGEKHGGDSLVISTCERAVVRGRKDDGKEQARSGHATTRRKGHSGKIRGWFLEANPSWREAVREAGHAPNRSGADTGIGGYNDPLERLDWGESARPRKHETMTMNKSSKAQLSDSFKTASLSPSKELIEAVRELSPIDRVVGGHVRLRRSGLQLVGQCPFHTDRTPSFSVHPGKQVYRCHGCGVGGDVFDFVERLHGCSFAASIHLLAARAGLRTTGFVPSRELSARVAATQACREEERAFERFCNDRIAAVNEHYRNLGRAATHAENWLCRGGESDPHIYELAWSALERFTSFAARVEREGLVDIEVLRHEWQARRGVLHVAP